MPQSFPRLPLAALALLLLAAPARAMLAPTYDLDSLVFLSTDIVEATIDEIVTVPNKTWDLRAKVTVTHVALGTHKEHDSLTVASLPFYVTLADNGRSERITAGHHVWIFIRKPSIPFYADNALPADVADAVLSGVRLISNGHVLTPHQHGNPGPFAFRDAPDDPTEKQFREQITASLRYVADIRARLDKPPAPTDPQWIIPALKARPARKGLGQADQIANLLTLRLVNLHDPVALFQVINPPMNLPYRAWQILDQGFSFPAGRSFLLGKLSDPAIPLERRLALLDTLKAADADFNFTLTTTLDDNVLSGTSTEDNLPDNGHYLQHLAELAANPATDPALSAGILRTLRDFIPFPGYPILDPVHADFLEALTALDPLYTRSKDPETLFLIDVLAARSGVADQHHTRNSPILGLTRHMPPQQNQQLAPTDLPISLDIAARSHMSNATLTFDFILRPVNGSPDIHLPFPNGPLKITANEVFENLRRTEILHLPADLPSGVYHAFTRISKDDNVIDDSRGFDLTIP